MSAIVRFPPSLEDRYLTAAVNANLLVPEALYANEVHITSQTLEIFTRPPEIVHDLLAAELRRRTFCTVFARDDDFWALYIKVVIVPGPVDRYEDEPRDLPVAFRPIVARDEWERQQRRRAQEKVQAQELLQRILADNSPEEEEEEDEAGAELAVARTRFHATRRFACNTMRDRSARQRYLETKAMWESFGRQWKKDCRPSGLRHVMTYESIAAAGNRGTVGRSCLGTDRRLVACFRRRSW